MLVLALTVAALLPFVDKPFHVDDPLFIWSAEQIRSEPLNFYGTSVNWIGIKQPLSTITKNPPLVCYAIAAVSSLVGLGERALHLAFLVPAVAATLGTWFLAARLGAPPTLAALALLASPVFLTSATSVMCDVPMLACFVWALFFWVRGIDERRVGSLFVASGLVAAAALSKYFAMALVPLLALYALWRERRIGVWCLALLPPLLVLAAYQWGTSEFYGRGLLTDAAVFASASSNKSEGLLRETLVGLSFLGGCAATLLFFLPSLAPSRRWLAGGLVATGALAIALPVLHTLAGYSLHAGTSVRWGPVLQVALHAMVGLAALGLALSDFARRRSADSALLLAWVLGTFVFAAFVNWTANARSILPLMPALAILIARRLEQRGASPLARFLPLAPAAALALVVAFEDQHMAQEARREADALHAAYASRPEQVWFKGHWGFQYYMQTHGFRAIDLTRTNLAPGDLIVQPFNNYNLFGVPESHARRIQSFEEPRRLVAVMDRQLGAGFYSSLWGPLPYAFGRATADGYAIYETLQPTEFRLGPPGSSRTPVD